jgi:hypothetical protein
MFLGLRIFSDRPLYRMIRPMISFWARNIDEEMLPFLESPPSNTAGTLLITYINFYNDFDGMEYGI